MRLDKRLTIGGQAAALMGEDIRLRTNRPGAAIFQVRADEPPSGDVSFAMGWHMQETLTAFFAGYIETATPSGAGLYKLFCRELPARLDVTMPISLRHPTLAEVLEYMAGQSGLAFKVPDRTYSTTRIPAFYNIGSGYNAMDKLGQCFGIPDYFWQAQGDGVVFVGSWADSRWTGRDLDVPSKFFAGGSIGGSRSITAIPGLRPGAVINGLRVTDISFKGHTMGVTCNEQ